jgi:hypothetical protein
MKDLRRPKRILTLAATLVALTTGPRAASPWVKPKGEGFVQLSLYGIGPYETLYNGSGEDFRTGRELTEYTVEVYGEYGLTDRWTLVGTLPFRLQEAGDLVSSPTLPSATVAGTFDRPGNLMLGVRGGIIDAGYVLAWQADFEFPTGDFDDPTGLSTGYDAFTVAPTIAAGKSFARAYVSGTAGVALRSDDFSSSWRVGVEGGFRVLRRLWLVGVVDVVQSFEDGDVQLPANNLQTGLYVNDQEWVAYGLKGLIDINDRVGLHVTFNWAADGNAVPKSMLSGAGVYYRW